MNIKYIGTNHEFASALDPVAASATGRFRSHDTHNRTKYPLTSALLDRLSDNSSSIRLKRFHHRALYAALRAGMLLDLTDMQ